MTSFKRKEWQFREKGFFCLGSLAFQVLVMTILCKRGGRKKGIPRMDFIQRCRELSICLWTRPQEPSTSKSSIRIHKSSPALSLCLSLAEHTTFKSAPRFLLVQGSGLQESAELKRCMGSAPALPGRGPSLTFASLAPNAGFSSWITYSAFSATQEGFNKQNLEQLPTGWTCVRIWVSRKAGLQKCSLRLFTKIQRPCKKEKESAGSCWELFVHPWNKKICESAAGVRSRQARCRVWVVCVCGRSSVDLSSSREVTGAVSTCELLQSFAGLGVGCLVL